MYSSVLQLVVVRLFVPSLPYLGFGANANSLYFKPRVNPLTRRMMILGKWTQEEQDQLKQTVHELSVQQGKSIGGDSFWSEVSEAMGKNRSRWQCHQKWFVI